MTEDHRTPLTASPTAKIVVTGLLAVFLLVPLMAVGSLVSERAARRDEVKRGIGAVWGGPQSAGAVVLSVPFEVEVRRENEVRRARRVARFLPEDLRLDANVSPEIRRRGIFPVVVYRAAVVIAGSFAPPAFDRLGEQPVAIHWDRATLGFGIADMRGVTAAEAVTLQGRRVPLEPGGQRELVAGGGLVASVPMPGPVAVPFEARLALAGTDSMLFIPAGRTTTATLTSTWPHPGFSGAFLPEAREPADGGFTARWRVPYFARPYPQAWVEGAVDDSRLRAQAAESAFGVDLVQPVDQYQQAERAVKYGLLFVLLTFVVFFLWEVLRALRLHPVQYLLVGSALVVFYLLLLSISEHAPFALSYALAAGATTLLVAGYSGAILRAGATGALAIGSWVGLLYGLLYVILRLEDFALLVGALAVFAALAAVMYLTRRVEWNRGR